MDIPAGQLVVGLTRKEDEFDGDDLAPETQVCSCYNISKNTLVNAVKDGCQSFGEVKARTKAGTGCGGCVPLATSIFNSEMKRLGHTVLAHLCPHFKKSRQDLFMIVKIKKLTTFEDVMNEAGINRGSIGCEICKPAVASILSSLYNEFIMTQTHHQNQDTNDKYLANIQRNGTYSVIPRVPAGEIVSHASYVLLSKTLKSKNLLSDSCKIEAACHCRRKVFSVHKNHRRVRATFTFGTVHYLNFNRQSSL